MAGRRHEALHTVGGIIGTAEVDELQRTGWDRPYELGKTHARPLLDGVAFTGEVDAVH